MNKFFSAKRAHTGYESCEVPVGQFCSWCNEMVTEDDEGFFIDGDKKPYHIECHLRSITGGANHLLKLCSCFGGDEEPDPPQLSKHDAAKLAYKIFNQQKQYGKREC